MKTWKKFSILAALVLLMFTWRPAWAVLVNALEDFVQIGTPANPPAGNSRMYVSSTTHQLSCLNSDGSSCSPSGGGGGVSLAQLGVMAALSNPTSLTWTWFNQASSVVTTSSTTDAINLYTPNSAGNNLSGRTTPVTGSSPYTLTIGLYANLPENNFGQCGETVTNGTNYIVIRVNNNSGGFDGFTWTGTGSPATSLFSVGGPAAFDLARNVIFLRIQETSTNRLYSYSFDGLNFHQMFSETAGSFLVPTAGGFFALANGQDFSACTIIHAALTAP